MDFIFILLVLVASVYFSFNLSLMIAILLSLISVYLHLSVFSHNPFSYMLIIKSFLPPVVIFLSSYFISFITTKKNMEMENLRYEVKELQNNFAELSKKFNQVQKVKDNLEKKILRDEDFSVKLHDAISSLSKLNAEGIKKELLNITKEFINAKSIAFYEFSSNRFIIKFRISEHREIKEYFDKKNGIYQKLIETDSVLTVKDMLLTDENNVLMAGVLRKKNGNILGAIIIYDMDFVDLNFLNIKLFQMICNWGAIEIEKAIQFALYQSEFVKFSGTEIFNFMYFSQIINSEYFKIKRYKIFISVINMIIKDAEQINKEQFSDWIQTIGLVLKKRLRASDNIFFNDVKRDRFILVLPHTDLKGAEIVKENINKLLEKEKIYPYYDREKPLMFDFQLYYFDENTDEEIFSEFLISQAI